MVPNKKKDYCKHRIREDKLRKIVLESIDQEVTCASLLDQMNEELNTRTRFANSKQLGFYLKKVMVKLDDVVLEKKVFFLNPSSSIVKYVFRKVPKKTKQEIIKTKRKRI